MAFFKVALPLSMLALLLGLSSVSGGFTFQLQKVHIYIFNMLNPNIGNKPDLHMHCVSNEDDLHDVVIPYVTQHEIKFKVDIFGSTFFKCNFWYIDSEGANNTIQDFMLYDFKEYQTKCDHNDCMWHARDAGLYMWDNADENYLPTLMVEWNKGKPDKRRKFMHPIPSYTWRPGKPVKGGGEKTPPSPRGRSRTRERGGGRRGG